jgi:hypothetical protein
VRSIRAAWLLGLLVGLAVSGCGGSSSHLQTQAAATRTSTTQTATTSSTSTPSALAGSALSADALSAATGDIPDNQIFLVFTDAGAGWSMKYPEGWTQSGSAGDVTFHDKNNVAHVLVGSGAAPTTGSVAAQLRALARSNRTLSFRAPAAIAIGGERVVAARYTTRSAPNPVTGRSVTLIVDRYVLARGGRIAIVDLGTPRGVDNVDAYRLMVRSFRWR